MVSTLKVWIVLQGFGATGCAVAQALATRADAEIVAVVDRNPDLVGRRLADVSGSGPWADLTICHPDEVDFDALRGEVAIHATTAFASVAVPQLVRLLAADLDVVTLCQEFVYPVAANHDRGRTLDRVARRHGRSVIAAGVNPGWMLDLLPVAASLGCVDIRSVSAVRVVDFSLYGPDEMVHIGAGLEPGAFGRGARTGTIGHIGLLESSASVADALDLAVDCWEQTKEPLWPHESTGHRSSSSTLGAYVDPTSGCGDDLRGRSFWTSRCWGCSTLTVQIPHWAIGIKIFANPNMSLSVDGDDAMMAGAQRRGSRPI